MEHEVPKNYSPALTTNALRKGPIGLVIGLAILAFCIYSIGPEKILLSLRQVRPTFLLGGFFLIFCWLLLGALNIRTMLNPLVEVAYGKVLNAYSNANMVALIMPGQVGDVIIIKFFKDLNIPITQGITLFATDKAITLFWYGAFALYGLYLARLWRLLHIPQDQMSPGLMTLAVITIIIAVFLLFARRLLAPFSQRIRNWRTLARTYLKRARSAILLNILITLVRIAVMGGAYWLTIQAFGPSPTFIQALCFAITAGLVAYVPVSFNGLGTVEAALVYLYSTIGIESAPVLSASLTMRLIVIVVVSGCAMASSLFQRNSATE